MKTSYFLTVALLLTFIQANAQPLSGIKTIPGDYANFTAAINALNSQGIGTGGVIFNVAAGQTFNERPPALTATGTISNPIIFQKSGTGNNPVIVPNVAGTVSSVTFGIHADAIFRIIGGDFITIDGIDLQENTSYTNNTQRSQYGYILQKAATNDACKNVTIKNCTITLSNVLTNSSGIFISNFNAAGSNTSVNHLDGRHENIKIYGNTITAYHGIQLRSSTSSTYFDINNEIGVGGANTISHGGGTVESHGIWTVANNNLKIANNIITGTNTTGTINGIFTTTAANANLEVYNNTISLSNAPTTGVIYAIRNTMGGNGTNNSINIYNNLVQNCNHASTTSGSMQLIVNTATAHTVNIYGNTVQNSTSSGTGVMYGILQNANSANVNIHNNLITGLSRTSTTSTSVAYGIYAIGGVNSVIHIYKNHTHNLSTNGTTGPLSGIGMGNGNHFVFQNNVHNITGNSTSGVAYGIRSLASVRSSSVYNNFVSDIKAPSSTNVNAVVGVVMSGVNNISLYHNTIYIDASSTSTTTFGSSGIYINHNPLFDFRNNIVVNNSISGPTGGLIIAYRRTNPSTIAYLPSSGNNILYAGTPGPSNLIYFNSEEGFSNLNAFKNQVYPADLHSVSELPPFINITTTPYNLRLQANAATQVEGGASPITQPFIVNVDYDSIPRSNTAPDIGAHEGTFTPADFTGPTIIFSPLRHEIPSATSRVLSGVLITDKSGVDVSTANRPRIYYKKTTDANTYTGNTNAHNGWKWAEGVSTGTDSFSFTIDYSKLFGAGTISIDDTIQYFVVAKDNAPIPNFTAYDALTASAITNVNLTALNFPVTNALHYRVASLVTTTLTVGSSGTFPSLTGPDGAFEHINSNILSGNTTIEVLSNTTETGNVSLEEWVETGIGNYTLTILTPTSTVKTISGNFNGGLIRLQDTRNVIIDGNVSGTGKYLDFVNLSTNSDIATIQLISTSPAKGNKNVTIKNSIIRTGSNINIDATHSFLLFNYGIFIGGKNIQTVDSWNDATGEGGHENIFILNNEFTKANTGVFARGIPSSKIKNLNINNNVFGANTSANYITLRGITVYETDSLIIDGNELKNIESGVWGDPTAIKIRFGVENAYITRNSIKGIRFVLTYTDGGGGCGIEVYTNLANSNVNIINNEIADVTGDGWMNPDYTIVGIRVTGTSGGVNIWNNSVNLFGSQSTTWGAQWLVSTAVYLSYSVSNIDLRNNILRNSFHIQATPNYRATAIFSDAINPLTISDYNNYFVSGTHAILANYNYIDRPTLADFRLATTMDQNSMDIDPKFVSNTDLVPTACELNNSGTPLPGVTVDINGLTRSTIAPDKGAHEFTPVILPSPTVPSISQCTKGVVKIIASSIDPLAEFHWYNSNIGGNLIYTGDTFSTSYLNIGDTVVYFVEARLSSGLTCPSERTEVMATVLGMPQAAVIQGSIFQGQFNQGGMGNIDQVCTGDTVIYEVVPPTGFSNINFGTSWTIPSFSIQTSNGTPPSDTTLIFPTLFSNAGLMLVPSLNEGDSIFELQITVRDLSNGCDTIIIRYINVAPTPQANFTTANVCFGTASTFTNTTTHAPPTTNYNWNFGNNNTSTVNSPQHLYTTPGIYNVSLKAESNLGCNSTQTNQITVFDLPEAVFSITGNCANDSTKFYNQSVVHSGTHAYKWSFGKNNETSTDENPTYNYGNQGSYNVSLVVENNGCRDTALQVVNILSAPIASFTAQNFCQGSTTNFLNTTSFQPGTINYEWIIDGNTVTTENPTYTFGSAGIHPVTLKATQQNGCSDVVVGSITIDALPGAGFTPTVGSSGNVGFQASETGHATYNWNFGDGNSGTGATTNHVYTSNGTYNVRLTVTSTNGCIDSSSQTLSVINVSSGKPLISNGSLKIHPNPYSGSTNISYELPSAANVVLEVYNMEGKLVQQLVEQKQQSGNHTYSFSGSDAGFGPGMYLVKLIVDGKIYFNRIVELRY